MNEPQAMTWKHILHIHVYKNAGSTVDRLFLASFGEKFVKFDPGLPGSAVTDEDFQAVQREHPEAVAFSSHKVTPDIGRCIRDGVLPFTFIRHPLDRVRSTYDFEHRESPSRTPSQRYAVEHTFVEWLAWHLDRPGAGALGNFQTRRLGSIAGSKNNFPLRHAREMLKALPFFGIVERFNESIDLLQHVLGSQFTLKAKYERRNTTAGEGQSLSDRLDTLSGLLSDQLYRKLISAMEMDLAFYAEAVTLFHDRWVAARLTPGGTVVAVKRPR